jgi:uncharacterized protein YdhG (YjbR/CyaY superfamily)
MTMATRTTKKPAAKTALPKTVDEYLAAAPREKRALLTKLRQTIKAAAPKAVEGIAYGMAGFTHRRQTLVYFAYWTDHCALYGTSQGTIKFTVDEPLSDQLVTKLVKARIAMIEKA